MPPAEIVVTADNIADLSDRELLETIARDIAATKALIADIAVQAGPVIGMVSKNPMLKLFLK